MVRKKSWTTVLLINYSTVSKFAFNRREIMPGIVRLHHVLSAPPSRVYKAFLNPEALVKWLPPHGFTCKVHSMDGRVGGLFKMSFTNFTA